MLGVPGVLVVFYMFLSIFYDFIQLIWEVCRRVTRGPGLPMVWMFLNIFWMFLSIFYDVLKHF